MWSITQECEEENRIASIHAERASGIGRMAQQEEPEFRSPAHTEMPGWHGIWEQKEMDPQNKQPAFSIKKDTQCV